MKIYLDCVGCRLNQAEIERYAHQLRSAGHILVENPSWADLAIINTCTVTTAAASDSRQKIRQIARAGVTNIFLTGCWATLNPQEAGSLPSVCNVVPNGMKDRLVMSLLPLIGGVCDSENLDHQPIPGARHRTRAFIKAQDGCDNRCTFCLACLARGAGHSRTIGEVLADIRAIPYAQEIVLTGCHLGSWGQDFSPPLHLGKLVQAILAETRVPRLHLSSLEPWDLKEDFFELWQDPRLCRHLHLPLQSGCAHTLRRMGRKTTPSEYAGLVATARAVVPDISITTDLIAGFPGESEAEFSESLAFVKEMNFAGGHVFSYSARPGTAAASMSGQVPYPIRKKRNLVLRMALAKSAQAYRAGFLGQELSVLWETGYPNHTGWEMEGLSDNYLRVKAHANQNLWNWVTKVRIIGFEEDSLRGLTIAEH